MIHNIIIENNGDLNITKLCNIAMVSKSGFYAYEYRLKNEDANPREIQDRKDFDLILDIYNRREFKKGSRTIYMILKKRK